MDGTGRKFIKDYADVFAGGEWVNDECVVFTASEFSNRLVLLLNTMAENLKSKYHHDAVLDRVVLMKSNIGKHSTVDVKLEFRRFETDEEYRKRIEMIERVRAGHDLIESMWGNDEVERHIEFLEKRGYTVKKP